jgi:hypothetical protein
MSAADLTPAEREIVQDWLARRYLAIRHPIVGRRRRDRRSKDFRGDLERYIQWQIEKEPWRRLGPR